MLRKVPILDAPTGNLPAARLDVSTWGYHHEPPSAVDADLDRKTDLLFTITRVAHWTTAGFFLVLVLPAVLGFAVLLPPVALVVGGMAAFGFSIVAGLWHQQLRKHTGVPIIPVLEDSIEPFATSIRCYQEAFELGLQEKPEDRSPEEQQQLREFHAAARDALRAHHKMTRTLSRQFIIYGELAAQADRRGWKWLRDRHVSTIAKLILQVLRPNGDGNGDATVRDDASDAP